MLSNLSFSSLMNLSIGIVLIIVGLPLSLSKVPPNQWYGVRISKTMADTQVWYKVNVEAGHCMITVGGLLVFCAILLAAGSALNIIHPQFFSRLSTITLIGLIFSMALWLGVIVSRV